MKEKLIQSTAGALNCWRKCEECRVISNTGNNDQTGVASYGQKTPSWPAQYTVCNVQCMHNGPKLGTWSSWGPNCWNGPHLVLISRKKSHFPNYERKVAVKLWKGEKKVEISLITRVRGRVFLKGHFVKYQKAHPITQQGGTQGEHIQKEGINKQV